MLFRISYDYGEKPRYIEYFICITRQLSPILEPPRKTKEGQTKKHLAERFRGRHKENGKKLERGRTIAQDRGAWRNLVSGLCPRRGSRHKSSQVKKVM